MTLNQKALEAACDAYGEHIGAGAVTYEVAMRAAISAYLKADDEERNRVYEALLDAVENPPPPNERLKKLMAGGLNEKALEAAAIAANNFDLNCDTFNGSGRHEHFRQIAEAAISAYLKADRPEVGDLEGR